MWRLNCEKEFSVSLLSSSLNLSNSNSTSSPSGNSKESSVSPPKVFSTIDEILSESLLIISAVSAWTNVEIWKIRIELIYWKFHN